MTQMNFCKMQHFIMVCTVPKTQSIFRERNAFLKIITCDPSINTMGHPDLTVSNFMRNSLGYKGLTVASKSAENHPYNI